MNFLGGVLVLGFFLCAAIGFSVTTQRVAGELICEKEHNVNDCEVVVEYVPLTNDVLVERKAKED